MPDRPDARIAVVVSQFNRLITERLLEGALAELQRAGLDETQVTVHRVPGAWEIPLAAARAMDDGASAVVALGCVVRGETPHFDYICRAVTDGLTRLQLEHRVPVGFGVITADSMEQAAARAGGTVGHSGVQAVQAVLEMAADPPPLDA